MFTLRGSSWGPGALPDFLRTQLAAHGFGPDDAGRCARLINAHHGGAAAASLFVDLGSCKFLEADIDGAIAAWRHAIASQHDAAAARSMLNLGLLYEHLHLHDRALGLLARVAERNVDPYVIPAAMASARSQLALGHADQAMETMARLAQMAMVRRPDGTELIEALYGLGDVAEHAGRLDRAERAWRVAAASPASPVQERASARLIQLLVRQGHSQAVVAPSPGDALDGPQTSSALLDNVELLLRTGEKRLAAQLLATIEAGDFVAVDRFRFVDANLMAGRINEAIDELEVLLAETDKQLQNRALVSLGRVYASYDMIDPAVSMFQRAVASDDPYWMPAASLALGDVLAAQGERGPANEYWSYAAAGPVPRLAEQARERIEAADLQVADPEPTAPTTVQPSEPDALESAPAPADSDQDSSVPIVQATEPQVIPLDSIDVEVEPNGALPAADVGGTVAAAPVESEPVLVVLADVDSDAADQDPPPAVVVDMNERASEEANAGRAPVSVFSTYVDNDVVINPYAALAPDEHASDVAPTTRNPYAELAPNFAGSEFEPPADVEPGDWESMLDERSVDDAPKAKRRSSAFSRYT